MSRGWMCLQGYRIGPEVGYDDAHGWAHFDREGTSQRPSARLWGVTTGRGPMTGACLLDEARPDPKI